MRLKIENIGIIDSADIKLDGITVIAGANSSGKSTVGKIVYAITTGLNESIPLKVLIEKISNINKQVKDIVKRFDISVDIHQVIDELEDYIETISYSVSVMEEYAVSEEEIKNANENFSKRIIAFIEEVDDILAEEREIDGKQIAFEYEDDNSLNFEDFFLDMALEDIENVAMQSLDDDDIKYVTYQNVFNSEFNSQIMNIVSDNEVSKIEFKEINSNEVNLVFISNEIDIENSSININREFARSIYIDNPSIIDEILESPRASNRIASNKYNHRIHLYNILRNTKLDGNIFSKKKNDKLITMILNEVINGNLMINGRKSYYELKDTSKEAKLSLSNLSTGMKSFSVLAILKDSGLLNEVEYVILDEPEIHLHPEWQLKYAELIILLTKYLNIKFLVTSHSPYFVEAIELFSKKHQISSKVNYYKSVEKDRNHFEIVDCTEKLDWIYDELANALFTLEELRDLVEEKEEE